jgi:hypothetical protein
MTDETPEPRAGSQKRTVLIVLAVMSAAALITFLFALQTVANRRGHDLRPGPVDPLLNHLAADTVMACGWTGPVPPALAGSFAKQWLKTAADPGDPPWCMTISERGAVVTSQQMKPSEQNNLPFLARLVASRRGSKALFWIAAAGNQQDAPGWLKQLGFPGTENPALADQISQNAWTAWVEPESDQWVVRCVVRPTDEAVVRGLAALAESSAPAGLRHLRDGGDVLFGWKLPTTTE